MVETTVLPAWAGSARGWLADFVMALSPVSGVEQVIRCLHRIATASDRLAVDAVRDLSRQLSESGYGVDPDVPRWTSTALAAAFSSSISDGIRVPPVWAVELLEDLLVRPVAGPAQFEEAWRMANRYRSGWAQFADQVRAAAGADLHQQVGAERGALLETSLRRLGWEIAVEQRRGDTQICQLALTARPAPGFLRGLRDEFDALVAAYRWPDGKPRLSEPSVLVCWLSEPDPAEWEQEMRTQE